MPKLGRRRIETCLDNPAVITRGGGGVDGLLNWIGRPCRKGRKRGCSCGISCGADRWFLRVYVG